MTGASTAVYKAPAATSRACRDCGDPLPPTAAVSRLYCDRCRARRRTATFLRSARASAVEAGMVIVAAEIDELRRLVERQA